MGAQSEQSESLDLGGQNRAEPGPRESPPASSPEAKRRMQRQSSSETKPEMAIRRELHRRGLRYRVGVRPLPEVRRTADLVFRKHKVAVYVDGCFWHVCPKHSTWPKLNTDWWEAKLKGNVQRDRDTDRSLGEKGWTVIRIWEHENPVEACNRVQAVLDR